jgi:Predicted membrane protein (DUF2079)
MRSLTNHLLIIIIIASLVIGISTLTRGHEWGDDFASYVMQAQSILNDSMDEFVERNGFTIFESSIQIGPVAYPWGYPLLLVPSLVLKGVHPLTLKLPGLFFFLGFLICLYLLTEKRLTRTESLILVALFAFNPILIKFLDFILSDIPFLFFIFFALLWILAFKPRGTLWKNIATGVVLFFAFFIRTTGIILLAAYLVFQIIRFFREREKRKEILTGSGAVVVTFGLLMVFTSLILPNGQGSYFEQLKGLTPEVLQKNIANYFLLIGSFFGNGPAWTYLYYILAIFFLLGVWSRLNDDLLLIVFFFGYFAAMIFWPEWQGIRFVFPLLPLFVYFAFQGIRVVINKLPEKYQRAGNGISTVFWLVIVGMFLFTSGTGAYSNLRNNRKINGPFEPYSSEMFTFIKTETPQDSVIVFFKPRAMRLFTDRDAIMSIECDRLPLGDYVALHKTWEYSQILPGDIQKCDLSMNTVFENRKFIVYQLQNK